MLLFQCLMFYVQSSTELLYRINHYYYYYFAVVVHSARVLPIQSFMLFPWPSSASCTVQSTFENVCAEVLCSDHVPKVLYTVSGKKVPLDFLP